MVLVLVCVLAASAAVNTADSTSLPQGWHSRDVGKTRLPGAAAHADGTFVVVGGGRGIGGSSDRFHFAYTVATGDVDIIARLASWVNMESSTRIGVMIRASLNAKAAHGFMLVRRQGKLFFSRRQASAEATAEIAGNRDDLPVWLKLERRGTAVFAYASPDGVNWTFVGGDVLELSGAEVFVGLAVTSGDIQSMAMAVFDRVIIRSSVADGSVEGGDGASGTPGGSPEPPPGDPASDPEPSTPVRLVFEPSADHRDVSRYVFEVVVAASRSSLMLAANLGKPAVVNGECSAEITGLLADLPPGTYVGRLKAVNASGSSEYAYSGVFSLN